MKKLLVIAVLILSFCFSQVKLTNGQSFTATNDIYYVMDQKLTMDILEFRTKYMNLTNERLPELLQNASNQIQAYQDLLDLEKQKSERLSNIIKIDEQKQLVLSNGITMRDEHITWMEKKMVRSKFEMFIEKNDGPFMFILGAALGMVGTVKAINWTINK